MDEQFRNVMNEYWQLHSLKGTVQECLLHDSALIVDKAEKQEILGRLGDVSGLDILELGAGIGRYTGSFAEKASKVVAVDFMQTFTDKNIAINGHLKNVEILCCDVMDLRKPAHSFDIVFANWLFMYLQDLEFWEILSRIINWLRPGGKLFFHESCFHSTGDKDRSSGNPTIYRTPKEYNNILKYIKNEENGKIYCYSIDSIHSMQVVIQFTKKFNNFCWMVSKVSRVEMGQNTFQQFLNDKENFGNEIVCYEKIFGENFISTGGLSATMKFVEKLDLKEGENVLDIGSRIGGSAIYMAKLYGSQVLGIDSSSDKVAIAFEKVYQNKTLKVNFEVADFTKRQFPDGSFNVIYSFDSIAQIDDKLKLFKAFYKYLKPGGRILISDNSCGEKSKQLTLAQYGELLKTAGFSKVLAEDCTQEFLEILALEISKMQTLIIECSDNFSKKELNNMINCWQEKVRKYKEASQCWGVSIAWKE